MKRTIAAALMAFSVCCLIVCAVCFFRNSTETSPVFAQSTSEQKAEPETLPSPTPGPQITTLRFSATGDNLIHNGIYEQAKRRAEQNGTGGYDFSYCYDQVRQFYSDFDINWINQETLVSDTWSPVPIRAFPRPAIWVVSCISWASVRSIFPITTPTIKEHRGYRLPWISGPLCRRM